MSADRGVLRLDEVASWLRTRLSDSLRVSPEAIRPDAPLALYGMDSLIGAMMLTEIQDEWGVLVDPSDVPPGMTIDDLADLVLVACDSAETIDRSTQHAPADTAHPYPKDSDAA